MINLKLSAVISAIYEIAKSTDKTLVSRLSSSARTIRDCPYDIAALYYNGNLRKLPGIDKFSYQLIEEYIKTGKIKIYQDILTKYSEELLKIIRMSGLGSKKMLELYNRLNIRGVEDLKNKLIYRDFDGDDTIERILGGTGVDRLLRTIEFYENTRGFIPRGYIENFLEEVTGEVRKLNDVARAEIVGSTRRKKSLIKDIDILLLPNFNFYLYNINETEKLIDKLKNLYFVKGLVKKDVRDKSISARFSTIFDIDVEFIITDLKNWIVDLIYTTGSKKHIERLNHVAKRRGLLEEGRIGAGKKKSFILEKNTLLANISNYKNRKYSNSAENNLMDEEKIVYGLLGMQYIPPELRKGENEIELAEKNLLPKLIDVQDIKGDLHVHSTWSDGLIGEEEMVEKAVKFNYEYIAVTDHSKSNIYGNGLDEKRLENKIKYIEDLNLRFGKVKFLMGSEVEIKKAGKLDYEDEILEKMDIVISSIHTGYGDSAEKNTLKMISASENKYVDVIAHPTGVVLENRAPLSVDLDRVIKACKKYNKAIEINSYFLRLDVDDENARKAKENGVKLVINTDSHRFNNMDMIRFGVDIARRAGLEKDDVLNTLTLKELFDWKKQR